MNFSCDLTCYFRTNSISGLIFILQPGLHTKQIFTLFEAYRFSVLLSLALALVLDLAMGCSVTLIRILALYKAIFLSIKLALHIILTLMLTNIVLLCEQLSNKKRSIINFTLDEIIQFHS